MPPSPQDDNPTTELERVFARYSDAIFRYIYLQIGDRDVSKDLTQETFVRFWQCLERGEEIKYEQALLYRMARNLLIDHTRRKKSLSLDVLMEEGFEPSHDPLQTTQNHMEWERAMHMLKKLPEQYRQALMLRYVENLEPAEIAKVTNESPNVISVRIHRGLKELKSLLTHG